MTSLRQPSNRAGRVAGLTTTTVKVPPPALVLVSDLVCDGCRWPERCQQDRLCWIAEKAAIAAERNV